MTLGLANSTRAIGTAGLNLLDLRGPATERTLVLVNGRRHMTSTPGSQTVDVKTIPTQLRQSIDLVTGGSSALQSSTAVTGVVNFVLRRDFEALELRAHGGISDRSERDSPTISGVWRLTSAAAAATWPFRRICPLGATGTGAGSGIYNSIGRYFYAGLRIGM